VSPLQDSQCRHLAVGAARFGFFRAVTGFPGTVFLVRRLVLPLSGLLFAVLGFVLLRSTDQVTDSGAATAPAMRACVLTQGESLRQNPVTVECLTGVMVDAVEAGTYADLLGLRAELEGSSAGYSCHAAGHAAGLELVERFGMDGTIDRLFDGPVEETEYTCTAALVHGLVGGMTDGEPPFDLEFVASQCRRLEAEANFNYSNECAHFFGHAVWRSVGELTPAIADLCSLLGSSDTRSRQRTCISGAIMQKFDLQTKHYDPSNAEAQQKQPPPLSELFGLCDVFAGEEFDVTEGCMGAAGWLAAVSTNDKLEYESSGPEWDAAALPVYLEAIAVCDGNAECHRNFINHLRANAYRGPVAREVCVRAGVEMGTCEQVIERYQQG